VSCSPAPQRDEIPSDAPGLGEHILGWVGEAVGRHRIGAVGAIGRQRASVQVQADRFARCGTESDPRTIARPLALGPSATGAMGSA
jgi:hypothetical protein